MTVGSPYPPETESAVKLSRRVSSVAMALHEKDDVLVKNIPKPQLRRQVSTEIVSPPESDSEADHEKKLPGPVVMGKSDSKEANKAAALFPNPLHDSRVFDAHKRALQLEADLFPMRLILSRLMAHTHFNRKGIFNTPVDPTALKLPDYFRIVKNPMDFGTIKAKLHAVAYKSRQEVCDHIRLVLRNAMLFNPPNNLVHVSAKGLLVFFEEHLAAFLPVKSEESPTKRFASAGLPNGSASNSPDIPTPVASSQTPATQHSGGETFDEASFLFRKRKKRGSRSISGHSCSECQGRVCPICTQGCLQLEPNLLICNGISCHGAKIRKGATYFVAPDGSRQYCQRCHIGLPAVLPVSSHRSSSCRYKALLLKRKNVEEVVENWLECISCGVGVHSVCAFRHEASSFKTDYVCPSCLPRPEQARLNQAPRGDKDRYTFVSGDDLPVSCSSLTPGSETLSADWLPVTSESVFLQEKVRDKMVTEGFPHAEKTIVVRVISDCQRSFDVPDVVRKHFRMPSKRNGRDAAPPSRVNYRSKAIALFQKFDGLEVCVFCVYVQEYDGNDCYDAPSDSASVETKKRVYVAYLDSVEHFRPRIRRTEVFQELLVSYLASAKQRGYQTAHIWACPPSRGNSFVFWNHPSSQRTPTTDRLVSWYHGALTRAVESGVVADIESLYESDFQKQLAPLEGDPERTIDGKLECPPLLDGDFWIEEAVRIHDLYFNRNLKSKPDVMGHIQRATPQRQCPAIDVALLLRDHIMSNPSSFAFRRPVNAAALKLSDYHKVISKPMDLGSVFSSLTLGEYSTLGDAVADVELVFENAKRYNPKGHPVHEKAVEMSNLFFSELNKLVMTWSPTLVASDGATTSWRAFEFTKMTLDENVGPSQTPKEVSTKKNVPVSRPVVDLVNGGTAAVEKRMVGNDTWLLDKRSHSPQGTASTKKTNRRKSAKTDSDSLPCKRRRQSWLAEEVGAAVRRSRTSFFCCILEPPSESSAAQEESCASFERYMKSHDLSECERLDSRPSIADMRHAFLEFSQFWNLEFDTLRRAKHSSAVILHHLLNPDAPGVSPVCTSCKECISGVRWHRMSRVVMTRKAVRRPVNSLTTKRDQYKPEELCSTCFSMRGQTDEFIPVQVSV